VEDLQLLMIAVFVPEETPTTPQISTRIVQASVSETPQSIVQVYAMATLPRMSAEVAYWTPH
jgi:hypothetical protein